MDGFFCRTREAFAPGDRLKFLLLLPAALKEAEASRATCLQGIADVVRIVACASGYGFSIGCRLSGYRVLTNPELSVTEMSALISEDGRFETWLRCE
jgi:hypothetical protein